VNKINRANGKVKMLTFCWALALMPVILAT
jgi:hypothetical protein